jgi:hypothetical protein
MGLVKKWAFAILRFTASIMECLQKPAGLCGEKTSPSFLPHFCKIVSTASVQTNQSEPATVTTHVETQLSPLSINARRRFRFIRQENILWCFYGSQNLFFYSRIEILEGGNLFT